MSRNQPFQSFDELNAGAGTLPGRSPEARQGTRRSRSRTRAAAETLHQPSPPAYAPPAPVTAQPVSEIAPVADSTIRAARVAGGKLGLAVRYLRDLEAENVVTALKKFVRRHPSSLIGAGIAGFMTGRALRGR